MDQTLKTKLEDAEQGVVESYEEALAYGDEESQKEEFYLKLMEEILITRNKAMKCEEALAKGKEETTIEEFESTYKAELRDSGIDKFSAKRTSEYKAFQARLVQIKNAFNNEISNQPGTSNPTTRVECDEFVMETEIYTIDPLTKREMENPVKNKFCGHHYERSSILEAIRINRRLRCPVAGCGNNKFVEENHLVEDDALKMRILNMRNEANEDDEGDDELEF